MIPPWSSSEIVHHLADLQSVDGRVIPAATVRGLLAATLPELGDQVLVMAAAPRHVIESLIVLNPEGNVPGLPVCPTVETVVREQMDGHGVRL